MSNKVQWIREVSQEINRSQASLKRAIKDTTIAEQARIIVEMEEFLRGLPLASGE